MPQVTFAPRIVFKPDSTPLVNGSYALDLVGTGTIIDTGGAAPTAYTFNLDSTGAFPVGSNVWMNVSITPSTVYTVTVYSGANRTGSIIYGPFTQIVGPSQPFVGVLIPDAVVYPLIPSNFNGVLSTVLSITGNSGLPTTIGTNLYLAGNFGTPHLGKIFIGDGSGWQLDFSKRSGSVTTDIFSFKDSGVFILGAAGDTGISRSSANQIAFGNGSAGDLTGTLVAAVFASFLSGTQTARCDNQGLSLASNMPLAISATTNAGASKDVGISRAGVGQIAVGNGTAGDDSGRLFQSRTNVNVTPVTVTGTVAQTALQAVTLKTGELNAVGRWITLSAHGFLTTGGTAGTWTLTLKLGTTTLFTTTVTPSASATNVSWELNVDIATQTAGATGALEVHGTEVLTGVTNFASGNTATITGIDLTGAPTLTLFVTNTQTTTSCISRLMGYQRNN